ncbi:adenylyl-sulfate kinase [Nonomuraea sp. NPDC050786]|uniref:adenylyl-sulfate kinase n=1 Tax=Nonomuraea sp. NPDC050786 TaxID=3154840 RepID=UPI0034031537
MSDDRLPLLWLCGPSGVGKSSVGWEVFAQLSRSGVRTAFVDGDQIAMLHPLPNGGTHPVRARNLAAMWPNFRREGAQCVVLASYVNTADEVRHYTGLLTDAALTLCRLRVDPPELKERFLGRGWMPEMVEQAVADAEALDRTDFADLCVDTGGLSVPEVARTVLERAGGWPPAAAAAPSVPVLWFSGATAAGKSTVAYEVFTRVLRGGVPAAYVDLKQIGVLRPGTSGRDHHRLRARNLAALWAGYRADGVRCVIVSGDADRDDTVRDYAGLLPGAALTVCRLHAGPGTLAERVELRGRGGGPAIPGDELKGLDAAALRRVAEEAAREAEALEQAGAGDLRVETDGRTPGELADEVLAAWPHRP